jgi:hypothetical protein
MKRTATLADEFLLAYLSALNQLTEIRLRGDLRTESMRSHARAAAQRERVLESLVLPHLEQLA